MSQHVLSLLVEDKPGLLTRVAGLFARRGFNIESLAVGTTEISGYSRITVVVNVDDLPLEQVIKQLDKLVNVIKVVELEPNVTVERDHMLIKVSLTEENRNNVLETVTKFGARVLDEGEGAIMVEITDEAAVCEEFVKTLRPFGIRELAQSGVLAMARGRDSISRQVLGKAQK